MVGLCLVAGQIVLTAGSLFLPGIGEIDAREGRTVRISTVFRCVYCLRLWVANLANIEEQSGPG